MRVLLTGARAPATLELARLASRTGYEVHVADTNRWHICRGSRLIAGCHTLPAPRGNHIAYGHAIGRLVERLNVDVVVPTCEEVFHLASVRDQVGARIACEARDRLASLHDKWQFVDGCLAAAVPAPRTVLLTNSVTPTQLPVGEYILKRRFSRFATGVRFWRSGDAIPHLDGLQSGAWIAQQYVEGDALCTWSVASRGRVLAHATYAVDETAGPRGAAIAFHSVHHAAIRFWVETFIAHHRLSGQFAFDFVDGPHGLHGIECNPRLTSGVHCFRSMPDVARRLVEPDSAPVGPALEPPAGLLFRSRLALAMYDRPPRAGAGLLEAEDDPWPQRLQGLAWTHLLVRALLARTDPRLFSTRDIEWNGE
jgi:hypothetical protein